MESDNDVDIFFDLVGAAAPVPRSLDGFLFGVIFYAMRLREDIYIRGPVSFDGLANLNELQEAWRLWKPQRYGKVRIIPDSVVDGDRRQGAKTAIAAFSGGVDSIFTVLRHNRKLLGAASYPLEHVLMVHGFDVPLGSSEQWASLQERIRPLLDELNLKFLTIRTNLKEINLQNWEDSFMAQLACCLHNYSHQFGYGVAGSSEPYDALVLPWGSNPATDHLLSSAAMRLIHDGAGYSRTQKVAAIAAFPTATRVVKVCWEGEETSRNCGQCEKCIRTQLNFLAVGMRHPACFDKPLEVRQITDVPLSNDVHFGEIASIYDYARRHGAAGEWVDALGARIERYRHPPGRIRKSLDLAMRGEFSMLVRLIKKQITERQRL